MLDQHNAHILDGSPLPTFVVDRDHVVTHFNKACETSFGVKAADVIGTKGIGRIFYGHDRPVLADLIVDGSIKSMIDDLYQSTYRVSLSVPDAFEAEAFFPHLGTAGTWLFFTAAPLHDAQGNLLGAIETLLDISSRKVVDNALMAAQLEVEEIVAQRTAELANVNMKLREDVARREEAEIALVERNAELNQLNERLSSAQEHLVQSEKLASIGQLAAGVAHEINNPIGYIFSNFGTLEKYLKELFEMLDAYEASEANLNNHQVAASLTAMKKAFDIEFLKEDIPTLMGESREGIVRVRKIVQDLKDFSHVDATLEWQYANLNSCIDSTLNVVNNEIKYKADVVRDYGELPLVQCMASQINQVVMNLVVNAAHSIGPERGKVTVRTACDTVNAWFEISDTGSGIPDHVLPKIFDPFYTTKPVGKGTGLGLSLSYGIIQKHQGSIEVRTAQGTGTTFRVTIPLVQLLQAVPNQEVAV